MKKGNLEDCFHNFIAKADNKNWLSETKNKQLSLPEMFTSIIQKIYGPFK